MNQEEHTILIVKSNLKLQFSCLVFCDYNDAYILVKGTITVYAPFTDCSSEINNLEIDHAKDIDIGMPMYNLIEYSDNYSKHLEFYGNAVKIYQL